MAKSKYPDLQFERKNKHLQKVPKNARVQKRAIPRAPAASPYAGPSVSKIVYVSTKTPFMCAVKRVQKLLRHAEKRATSKVNLSNNKISEKAKLEQVVQAQHALKKEEVLVMATGRAIDKAISLEKWFKEKAEEYEVKVRTKAVLVVDDILSDVDARKLEGEKETTSRNDSGEQHELRGKENGGKGQSDTNAQVALSQDDQGVEYDKQSPAKSKSMRRKQRAKERKYLDNGGPTVPRSRYVNGVEISVSLK